MIVTVPQKPFINALKGHFDLTRGKREIKYYHFFLIKEIPHLRFNFNGVGGGVCLKNHIHLAELIIEIKRSDIIKKER